MKLIATISISLLVLVPAFAQNDVITKEDLVNELQPLKISIQSLQKENSNLKVKINNLNTQLSIANKSIDSLQNQIQANSHAITQSENKLDEKILATETNANQKITNVGQTLSAKSLYGIIGVLLAFLLSGLLYLFLSKRQKKDKSELVDQLQKTESSIEERVVNEFVKQTDSIESQLQLLVQPKQNTPVPTETELDHSFVLKVASEINSIERNIYLMDKSIKGLKPLMRSVGKLKNNLLAIGYEMPELLGKPYHPGMNAVVLCSMPDENLEKGSEIITKVLIPQVNFKDQVIQTAYIEVSVG